MFRFPGLWGGGSRPAGQRRRREVPQQSTLRVNYSLYRTEGLTKVQGVPCRRGGWGVLCFGRFNGRVNDVPVVRSWNYLGEGVTNNFAGYSAAVAAIEHAASQDSANVCIQTRSLLVAKQANCSWACRSGQNQALLSRIWSQVRALEGGGGADCH